MSPVARRRLVALAKLLLGLALAAAVVRWLAPDLGALVDRVRLDLTGLALGFAMTVVTALLVSLRWKLMVEAMGGTRLPFAIYLHGLALTKVVGQVTSTLAMDLVGRGLALRSAGATGGIGLATVQALLERLFDVLLPVAMLAWAIAVHRADAGPAAAIAGFTALCLLSAALAAIILWPLTRVALRGYLALRRRLGRAPADPAALAGPPPISRLLAAQVGLLGVLRYVALVPCYWGVAWALGLAIDARAIALGMPLGQLAAIIGVTPGALGFQEAGWTGALRWVGGLDDLTIGAFVLGLRALVAAYFALLYALTWPLAQVARRRSRLDHLDRAADVDAHQL